MTNKGYEILKGFFPSGNFDNVAHSRLPGFCVVLTLTLVDVLRKSFALRVVIFNAEDNESVANSTTKILKNTDMNIISIFVKQTRSK